MIKIRNARLPADVRTQLGVYQSEVDVAANYEQQVAAGKKQFKRRNTRGNRSFRVVRDKLTEMCDGARRCMYCEDSVADEVEHFSPKDLYPELVFAWSNYLYACGPCNGPKNNRFKVVPRGGLPLVDVTRARRAPVVPPAHGRPALINPRRENPLALLMLDLRDTFAFTPIPPLGSVDYERATYTIDMLHLNDRDYLVDARRNAYGGFRGIDQNPLIYRYTHERRRL